MKPLLTVFTLFSMLSMTWVMAQTSQQEMLQTSFDCTHLNIEEVDGSLLTKAERLAMMDKNLQTSMDKYDQCMLIAQQHMAGGKGALGVGDQNGTAQNSAQSVESSQTQGQQTITSENTSSSQQPSLSSQPSSHGSNMTNSPSQLAEPKDNDSIICTLLWQEIQTAEPDKIEGFTKQYNDYKCG